MANGYWILAIFCYFIGWAVIIGESRDRTWYRLLTISALWPVLFIIFTIAAPFVWIYEIIDQDKKP